MDTSHLVIEIQNQQLEVTLYDNPSTRALVEALPLTLSMNRWGGEYFGSLPTMIPAQGSHQNEFEPGDVALWPSSNALCIFFGPTPVSQGSKPKMASPGVPFGKIHSNATILKQLGDNLPSVKLFLRP